MTPLGKDKQDELELELETILFKFLEDTNNGIILPDEQDAVVAAKQALDQYITDRIKEAIKSEKDKRIAQNKSLCGCPMCLHHTDPYERHVAGELRGKSNG